MNQQTVCAGFSKANHSHVHLRTHLMGWPWHCSYAGIIMALQQNLGAVADSSALTPLLHVRCCCCCCCGGGGHAGIILATLIIDRARRLILLLLLLLLPRCRYRSCVLDDRPGGPPHPAADAAAPMQVSFLLP
jgi:hypothetical protein